MKTVLDIFARDIKALVRNPIALLVVGALLILPGLYAWYCIVANWDPYSNTGNMPVAIVNKDRGTTSDLTGEVNIGQQVTDKLKDNDSIDWRFYDSEERALEDTSRSICYATIVLPEDLSEHVTGIFEGSSDPPTIYYYPNEKPNAVATKVSDSAAQTLIQQVNQGFSSTVNETLIKAAQDAGDKLEERVGQTNQSVSADIAAVRKDIDEVIVGLDDALSSIDGYKEAIAGMDSALTGASQQLPTVRDALTTGSSDVQALRDQTGNFESSFAQALLDSGSQLSSLSSTVSADVGTVTSDLEQIGASIDGAIASLESIVNSFSGLLDPETIAEINSTLESLRQKRADIDSAIATAGSTVNGMNAKVQTATTNVSNVMNSFSTNVMPKLSDGAFDLASALSGLSAAIGQFEPQIGQLQNVLAQTDDALDRAVIAIGDAKTLLRSIGANLDSTVTDLNAMGSALQVNRISELLNVDPDNVGQFVSTPVNMVTEKIYPVSNYGTAVSPFYTNLALWIGCFILISLMKLEVDQTGFEGATATQRYFGRWLLLVVLALLQSQVICGVDILLGIDCANPAIFMLAGAACSFAYMNLIFALAITFRNLGKTLCILLLIMQVPGSSGMYPIEMMPDFFQSIHPALPFTYGIDAMREALCGTVGLRWLGDLGMLLLIIPISLLIGLALRPALLNLTQLFDSELGKAGFFTAEEHGKAKETERVRSLLRALASHDDYRDSIEERAWKFNRHYPKLKRLSTVALLLVPLVFIAIMFPLGLLLDLDIDAKLFAFGLMIFLMLLASGALLVLEYAHRTIREEAALIGAEIMGESPFDADMPTASGPTTAPAAEAEPAGLPLDPDVMAMLPLAGPSSNAASKPTAEKAAAEALSEKRKRGSGAALEIFKTDLRLGFHSVIGVAVIMLLVITPSLYAWFNIAGSWDPYSNTGGLRVAVANQDEGYKGELMPLTVNVGDTVVSQLRGNHSFNWTFVDSDEAIEGVTNGDYYAAIVIPADFSSNMMTYIIEDSDYPDVLYYTNEKENPIAPIITQKGASSIQENIRATFTKRVDEIGLTIASDALDYVNNPRVSSYFVKMGGHLDDAVRDMGSGSSELKTLSSLSSTVAGVVDTAGVALSGVKQAGDSAKAALVEAEAGAANADAAFGEATSLIEESLPNGNGLKDVEAAADTILSLISDGAADAPTLLANVADMAGRWSGLCAKAADDLRKDTDPKSQEEAALFDSLAQQLGALSSRARTASENAAQIPSNVNALKSDISLLTNEAEASLSQARTLYRDNIKGSIENLKASMGGAVESTRSILTGIEGSVSGLSNSTSGLSNQLNGLSQDLLNSGERLSTAAAKIREAKKRLTDAINSGDAKQLSSVLIGSDTTALAARLATPIDESRQPMYSVRNYGSSMAPFYTVLSLWVGALVMISTMRVHVVEERMEELRRRYAKVKPRHEYLGRYGIFGFIGLLQSVIVLLGDLMFLQIQCVNPILFMLFGIFIGQVFCLIVYTLTELFGDIGKALCVILLIMQVAASGGTFPVEMMSGIFVQIAPYLPFYSAMSLLQECVAGVYLPYCLLGTAYLLGVVGVVLLIGIVVRRPFRIMTDWFEHQLEKTGYM